MRIVVTGAGGFIGANLCGYFSARGHDVVAVDHKGGVRSWRFRALPKMRIVHADLGSDKEARRLVRFSQPEVFINCAAYGAYSNQTDEALIYRVNFDAVRHLLGALSGSKRLKAFIQAGTSSEYGLNCSGPSEAAAVSPDSHYAVSKAAATALVQYYGSRRGMPAWSLRIYSAYGPLEEVSRLVPTLLTAVSKGTLPPLVSPAISRDFIYIDDLTRAIDHLIRRSSRLPRGRVYNIGTGRMTTLRDLVSLAKRAFSVRQDPLWGSMADRRWDNPRWYADPRRAKKELGWAPKVGLEQGLKRTARWMRDHPDLLKEAWRQSVIKR